ncbi:MAG TPA: hypothetical protein PKJ97_02720, partial [Candidatus Bilamarchaeaceae archaeon]|nr:hypothetical protein [Candidatus Bilamarchaeaceae archaeon]
MTTKPSYRITPMSPEHIRWAVRDILRDPGGPLRDAKIPESINSGKADAHAVVELLSSCGIRRGAKEFFARVLEHADEDADVVDRHIGGYEGMGQSLAAKSLIKIIVVNAREGEPDLEMEAALFACMEAAEALRGRDGGLALAFLEFCGSAAFGSESLKRLSRFCCREEVAETALSIRRCGCENTDAVLGEFFLAVRQVSCNGDEGEADGALRMFLQGCMAVAGRCPHALYSFLYSFCNSSWESVEGGLMHMGIFTSPGAMQAFSSMGKNYARIAGLADECLRVSKLALDCAKEGRDGVTEAINCFSDALGKLGPGWPAAVVPFASYYRALMKERRLDRLQRLADSFTSEDGIKALESLGDDPRMQAALMEACYMYA